jgi:hypothetical protein
VYSNVMVIIIGDRVKYYNIVYNVVLYGFTTQYLTITKSLCYSKGFLKVVAVLGNSYQIVIHIFVFGLAKGKH